MESIHEDFTNYGFSVIVLRPEHTVTEPNQTKFGPYYPHSELYGPGGYL
ncbi:Uncharacterised protein [Mycobacteroides abscessus subsp. abscessus]|nr:Uncharacterised protein [Mycobacteroides abscessus subsp. abscessus]